MTKYADELGKCYGKRGNLRIYKDGEMFAIFLVMKEFDFDNDGKIVEGEKEEAVLVGYIADIKNKEYAFDMAQEEIKWAAA
jgi:hypothetical protein